MIVFAITYFFVYTLRMVFLLYGPGTYLKLKKAEELRESVSARNPLLVPHTFDLDDEQQLHALHEFCVVRGLFLEGKRFACVRYVDTFFNNDLFIQLLRRVAKDPDTVLLLRSDREKKFEKKMELLWKEMHVRTQFFPKLTNTELYAIALEHAASLSVHIDKRAIDFLIDTYAGDIYAIISDINKWSAVTTVMDLPFFMDTGEYIPTTELFSIARGMLYPGALGYTLSFFERALSQRTDLYAVFNIIAKMTSARDLIASLVEADTYIKNGLLDIQQAIVRLLLVHRA